MSAMLFIENSNFVHEKLCHVVGMNFIRHRAHNIEPFEK